MKVEQERKWIVLLLVLAAALVFVNCRPVPDLLPATAPTAAGDQESLEHGHEHIEDAQMLVLPELEPAHLGGGKLRVAATTSIIGDIVGQIGGDVIELVTLMGPGQDPHSYEPAPRDLAAVTTAHVVFVNGWNLEEGLENRLENVAENALLVPVSAYISPLVFHEEDEDGRHQKEGEDNNVHAHDDVDPHAWLNPRLVKQWVENIEHVLSDLDPANTALYESNAQAYLAELEELIAYYDEQVATIPQDRRKLVTNHDVFTYFARQYNFQIIGTIIPATSTVAEPSASALVRLIEDMKEAGVCTIFTESTVSDQLAGAIVNELSHCDQVQVLSLYTDAVGPQGSNADTYLSMMRVNMDAIVSGLQ